MGSGLRFGVDVFLEKNSIKNHGIGLVTNQTGITLNGTPIINALTDKGLHIAALFGPEHGYYGNEQDGVKVGDSRLFGIPVYSLYGRVKQPSEEMLEDVDVLVYDIQDIGCRYYTYTYTLANILKSAERYKKSVIVLDRPNPLGRRVEGGAISPEFDSFVGGYGLCSRHGATIGELALYLRGEYFPGVELEVIELENYDTGRRYSNYRLPWVLPSPNMPSVKTAEMYPGMCLFEGTNISEGRGTTMPFQIAGAPWIDGEKLRRALNRRDIPGVKITSRVFTPMYSKHKGKICGGVLVHFTDSSEVHSLNTGLSILKTVFDLYPDEFQFKDRHMDHLAGTDRIRRMIGDGAGFPELEAELSRDQISYRRKMERYMLY